MSLETKRKIIPNKYSHFCVGFNKQKWESSAFYLRALSYWPLFFASSVNHLWSFCNLVPNMTSVNDFQFIHHNISLRWEPSFVTSKVKVQCFIYCSIHTRPCFYFTLYICKLEQWNGEWDHNLFARYCGLWLQGPSSTPSPKKKLLDRGKLGWIPGVVTSKSRFVIVKSH